MAYCQATEPGAAIRRENLDFVTAPAKLSDISENIAKCRTICYSVRKKLHKLHIKLMMVSWRRGKYGKEQEVLLKLATDCHFLKIPCWRRLLSVRRRCAYSYYKLIVKKSRNAQSFCHFLDLIIDTTPKLSIINSSISHKTSSISRHSKLPCGI